MRKNHCAEERLHVWRCLSAVPTQTSVRYAVVDAVIRVK